MWCLTFLFFNRIVGLSPSSDLSVLSKSCHVIQEKRLMLFKKHSQFFSNDHEVDFSEVESFKQLVIGLDQNHGFEAVQQLNWKTAPISLTLLTHRKPYEAGVLTYLLDRNYLKIIEKFLREGNHELTYDCMKLKLPVEKVVLIECYDPTKKFLFKYIKKVILNMPFQESSILTQTEFLLELTSSKKEKLEIFTENYLQVFFIDYFKSDSFFLDRFHLAFKQFIRSGFFFPLRLNLNLYLFHNQCIESEGWRERIEKISSLYGSILRYSESDPLELTQLCKLIEKQCLLYERTYFVTSILDGLCWFVLNLRRESLSIQPQVIVNGVIGQYLSKENPLHYQLCLESVLYKTYLMEEEDQLMKLLNFKTWDQDSLENYLRIHLLLQSIQKVVQGEEINNADIRKKMIDDLIDEVLQIKLNLTELVEFLLFTEILEEVQSHVSWPHLYEDISSSLMKFILLKDQPFTLSLLSESSELHMETEEISQEYILFVNGLEKLKAKYSLKDNLKVNVGKRTNKKNREKSIFDSFSKVLVQIKGEKQINYLTSLLVEIERKSKRQREGKKIDSVKNIHDSINRCKEIHILRAFLEYEEAEDGLSLLTESIVQQILKNAGGQKTLIITIDVLKGGSQGRGDIVETVSEKVFYKLSSLKHITLFEVRMGEKSGFMLNNFPLSFEDRSRHFCFRKKSPSFLDTPHIKKTLDDFIQQEQPQHILIWGNAMKACLGYSIEDFFKEYPNRSLGILLSLSTHSINFDELPYLNYIENIRKKRLFIWDEELFDLKNVDEMTQNEQRSPKLERKLKRIRVDSGKEKIKYNKRHILDLKSLSDLKKMLMTTQLTSPRRVHTERLEDLVSTKLIREDRKKKLESQNRRGEFSMYSQAIEEMEEESDSSELPKEKILKITEVLPPQTSYYPNQQFNMYQARSVLKKAKEEKKKQQNNEPSLLDKDIPEKLFITEEEVNQRGNVIEFAQRHHIQFRVTFVPSVYSSYGKEKSELYEVLAGNQVASDREGRLIEIELTESINDMALLANLSPDDYRLFIDFIILNELMQGLYGIKKENPKRDKLSDKQREGLETGSQISAILTLLNSQGTQGQVQTIDNICSILGQVIKVGKDYLYNDENIAKKHSTDIEFDQLEKMKALLNRLVKPDGVQQDVTWHVLEEFIQGQEELNSELSKLSEIGIKILSAA